MSELPVLLRVGTLSVRGGMLHVSGWCWEDPEVPDGTYWPAEGTTDLLGLMSGRSVSELHDVAHGPHCFCPVKGFQVLAGPVVLGYDEPAPYGPMMLYREEM